MPGLPVASRAVRSAISTPSSPVTPSFAGRGNRFRSSTVVSASARSPSAWTTRWARQASRIFGFRWPRAATPKPPERSRYSRPSASTTRQPSASAQVTAGRPGLRPLAPVPPRHQTPQRVGGDVAGDPRILLQATQGVRVPMLPEGDVDPKPMTLVDEALAEWLRHAEQHLELVLVAAEAPPGDDPPPFRHEPVVVRRDRDVAAAVEEGLERPQQVRLQDDPDILAPGLAQLPIEPQRVVGRRRILHVDADEVAAAGSVPDD